MIKASLVLTLVLALGNWQSSAAKVDDLAPTYEATYSGEALQGNPELSAGQFSEKSDTAS